MRTKSDIFFVLSVVVLAFATSSVRSEYNWNGSEWVWQEDNSPQQSQEVEGSGDSFYEEGDDDTGGLDDLDDFSGDYETVDEPVNTYNSQNNFNTNNNRDYQQPKNNLPDYTDRKTSYGQDPNYNYMDPNSYNRDNSQNNNPTLEASPPYFGNEEEETDGIYVDGPIPTPPKTTTADNDDSVMPPPRDTSISSQPKSKSRPTSFFAQPGTLAAVIGGAVVGLLCAILCVMFVVYRMRKKDEGSYALDEPKRSPTVNAYAKHPSREFYA